MVLSRQAIKSAQLFSGKIKEQAKQRCPQNLKKNPSTEYKVGQYQLLKTSERITLSHYASCGFWSQLRRLLTLPQFVFND